MLIVANFCYISQYFCGSFGICPHMTDDNKDQLKGKDLLVAYYDVDYEKNPKGSNYWRNRYTFLFTLMSCVIMI